MTLVCLILLSLHVALNQEQDTFNTNLGFYLYIIAMLVTILVGATGIVSFNAKHLAAAVVNGTFLLICGYTLILFYTIRNSENEDNNCAREPVFRTTGAGFIIIYLIFTMSATVF